MNRSWAGFDAEDYYRASQIAMGLLDEDLESDLENEYLPESGHRIGCMIDDHGISQIARELTEAEQQIKDELNGNSFNLASEYKCYIYNDIDATFQYLRMGVIYYAMGYNAQKMQTKKSKYNDEIEIHEKFLYQAISVDEWELAKENASPCPIIQAMLNEEYDLAKELLENYTEETDEDQEPYFIHMPYLKQIYIAILNGDENEFNEQLAKRINKYRKRPSDYQPVIDTTSIALIKMAEKLGLQYKFKVEEIPEYFLTVNDLIPRNDCIILDIGICRQAFEKWGNYTPDLEEIRQEIFQKGTKINERN